ncbi:hypothetical protein [uncultured Mucilaginibacter sp.]|nr:hypothetical protein [uncultured Mucilaginibacter sp.]
MIAIAIKPTNFYAVKEALEIDQQSNLLTGLAFSAFYLFALGNGLRAA